MSKIEKSIITTKFLTIKSMFEKGTNGSKEYGTNFEVGGELDMLCEEFVEMIGLIAEKFGNQKVVEDLTIDAWKDRIWSIIERAGLLPNIAWKDERDEEEIEDTWYKAEEEDEYEFNFEEHEHEAYDSI